jgi:hypothetical protein
MVRLERADHADIGAAEVFFEVREEGSKGWLALVGRDGKKNKFDLFFDDFCLSFAARNLVVDVARGVVGFAAPELHAASAEAGLAAGAREVVAGGGVGVGVDAAARALVVEGGDGAGGGTFACLWGKGTTERDGNSEEKGLGKGLEGNVAGAAGARAWPGDRSRFRHQLLP